MAVKIKPLRKFSTGNPALADMEEGEIAVNTADQKIFMRDNNNAVVEVANASGSAADDITLGDAAVNIATSSGDITIDAQGSDTDIIFKGTDNTTDITALTLDMSEGGFADFRQGAQFRNSVLFSTDGVQLKFGTNNEIGIQHVHNVGLLLTETGGGQPTLQFVDSNESVSSDGTNLILTSGGNSITVPNTAGTVALTSQIPTVPTNASIHLKPHFVKVSNVDSDQAGTKYIKVATINSSTPSSSSSTFVFRILLEGRNERNGASQFRVHIRTGDNAAKSSVVVEQEHSNRHTYYGIDSFIFFWNSQNNSEFWVKLPNNGDTAYQQLFAKLEVSAPEDTEYVSGHDDVTIHTSQAWTTSAPTGTNEITAEWIKKRFDSIIFEGSTTDNFETFLQGADATSDRVITLPDASGTVHTTANPEINGAYGSTSAPRIFKVTVGGQITAHPYYNDGSTNKYSIDGVQGAALTLHGADDDTSNSEYIYRFDQSDSSNNGHPLRFYLQADKTNPYTTGVTTNGTPGQAGAYTQIAVTKSTPKTLFYQCSAHAYMGNYVTVANSTKFTADNVIGTDTVTATKLRLTSTTNATGSATTHALQIGSAGAQNLRLDTNQIASYSSSGSGDTFYINPQGGQVNVGTGGLKIMGDGNDIKFGTNNEIVLTHVHDTGLLLTDTGGSPTLQLHDSNESVSSDGTNLILTSGGTAFKMPTSDGTGGHFLKTDGSGNLSFAAASGGSASDSFKTIAVSGQSDVVADSSTDTLTLVASTGMTITTNASNDTITFASSGGGSSDSFKTISVSGQSDVVADSSTDTLTLVAGNNMTITTNASGDEISFAASGGAGSGITEEQAIAFAIVYG